MQSIVIPNNLIKTPLLFKNGKYTPCGVIFKQIGFSNNYKYISNILGFHQIENHWYSLLKRVFGINISDLKKLHQDTLATDRYSRRIKVFINFLESFHIPYIISSDAYNKFKSEEPVKLPEILGTSYLYNDRTKCFCSAGALLYNVGVHKEQLNYQGSLNNIFTVNDIELNGFDILQFSYNINKHELESLIARNDAANTLNRSKWIKKLLKEKSIKFEENCIL